MFTLSRLDLCYEHRIKLYLLTKLTLLSESDHQFLSKILNFKILAFKIMFCTLYLAETGKG